MTKMNKPFKTIQLTDFHILSDKNSMLQGVDTYKTLERIIKTIILTDEIIHDVNAIFVTGDLSQDGSSESYHHIGSLLSLLNIPIFWIPGNHDDNDTASEVLVKYPLFNELKTTKIGTWQFIGINSCVAGEDYGSFSDVGRLNAIQEILMDAEKDEIHCALIMHHQPIEVGTPLMDSCMLKNGEQLISVLKNQKALKLIICGHVHENYSIKTKNFNLESSAATCFQIKKGTLKLEIEKKSGLKIYEFHKNGYEAYSLII